MGSVLTVTFGDGDLVEQLYALKLCALSNQDVPALWRLTDRILELLLATASARMGSRWPAGYVTESRLFDVPVDFVHDMPHLLCENYVIYPYTLRAPSVLRAY